jgi:hypothetical protein
VYVKKSVKQNYRSSYTQKNSQPILSLTYE